MNRCKTKKGRALFLFCLLLMTSFGQLSANNLDSLENELITATGKERLNLLAQLSLDLGRVDFIRAEMLALEGLELAKTLQDSTTLYSMHFRLGGILNAQNRFQEAISRVIPSLNYFKKKKQNRNIGRGNLHLATIYSSKGDYLLADSFATVALLDLGIAKDTALIVSTHNLRGTIQYYLKNFEAASIHYNESLTFAKAIQDRPQISYALGNLGMIQNKLNNYPLALEYYFQNLELEKNDALSKAKAFNNISLVYKNLMDWESALKYQKISLKIKEELGFPLLIARSLDNIGVIYKNMLNYGDALKYCKKALTLKKQMEGEGNGIEITLNNLGNVYSRLGDYENAFDHYQQSLDICLKRNNQKGVGRAYYNIANTKFKAQKYPEAISLALKSLQIAQERNDLGNRMSRNQLLSEIYTILGDHEKALKHSHSYIVLKDSIYSIEKLRRVTELENEKYQNELLAENNDLKQEGEQYNLLQLQLQLQQYRWLLLGSIALLLLIVFYFFKQKQKTARIKKRTAEKLETLHLNALKKDNMLQEQLDQLQAIFVAQSQEPKTSLTNMSEFLIENLNTEKDWTAFEHYFTRVHVNFFKELKTTFPNITPNELNLCALLRLNLLNNEIGQILGINSDSARRAQHRLAKKMGLSNNDALRTFLLKL